MLQFVSLLAFADLLKSCLNFLNAALLFVAEKIEVLMQHKLMVLREICK